MKLEFQEAVKIYKDIRVFNKYGYFNGDVAPTWAQQIGRKHNIPPGSLTVMSFALEAVCDAFYTKLEAANAAQKITGG